MSHDFGRPPFRTDATIRTAALRAGPFTPRVRVATGSRIRQAGGGGTQQPADASDVSSAVPVCGCHVTAVFQDTPDRLIFLHYALQSASSAASETRLPPSIVAELPETPVNETFGVHRWHCPDLRLAEEPWYLHIQDDLKQHSLIDYCILPFPLTSPSSTVTLCLLVRTAPTSAVPPSYTPWSPALLFCLTLTVHLSTRDFTVLYRSPPVPSDACAIHTLRSQEQLRVAVVAPFTVTLISPYEPGGGLNVSLHPPPPPPLGLTGLNTVAEASPVRNVLHVLHPDAITKSGVVNLLTSASLDGGTPQHATKGLDFAVWDIVWLGLRLTDYHWVNIDTDGSEGDGGGGGEIVLIPRRPGRCPWMAARVWSYLPCTRR